MSESKDKTEELMEWIASLNPVVIEVDKAGNLNQSQVTELVERVKSEVEVIKENNGHTQA